MVSISSMDGGTSPVDTVSAPTEAIGIGLSVRKQLEGIMGKIARWTMRLGCTVFDNMS